MEQYIRNALWIEFGAAIDYLADNIRVCPDRLWKTRLFDYSDEPPEFSQYWYIVYHTLYYIDLYLYGTEEGFVQLAPFNQTAKDDPSRPQRPFTQADLLTYLASCRAACKATIAALTDEQAQQWCAYGWVEASFFEFFIYSLRHVQEHGGQLNLFLGQNDVVAPDYITRLTDDPL